MKDRKYFEMQAEKIEISNNKNNKNNNNYFLLSIYSLSDSMLRFDMYWLVNSSNNPMLLGL